MEKEILKKFNNNKYDNYIFKKDNIIYFGIYEKRNFQNYYLVIKDYKNDNIQEDIIYDFNKFFIYDKLEKKEDTYNCVVKSFDINNYGDVCELSSDTIKYIKPFLSKDSSRYYIQGIYLDIENQCVVGTDGHKLYIENYEINKNIDKKGIIVKPPILQEATTICISGDNYIMYDYDYFYIITKGLVNAEYPDYQRVIPNGCENIGCCIEFRQLDINNKNYEYIIFKNKKVVYRDIKNNVDIEQDFNELFNNQPDDFEYGFRVKELKYCLDAMKKCGGDILYENCQTAITFKSLDKTIILMPIRV